MCRGGTARGSARSRVGRLARRAGWGRGAPIEDLLLQAGEAVQAASRVGREDGHANALRPVRHVALRPHVEIVGVVRGPLGEATQVLVGLLGEGTSGVVDGEDDGVAGLTCSASW